MCKWANMLFYRAYQLLSMYNMHVEYLLHNLLHRMFCCICDLLWSVLVLASFEIWKNRRLTVRLSRTRKTPHKMLRAKNDSPPESTFDFDFHFPSPPPPANKQAPQRTTYYAALPPIDASGQSALIDTIYSSVWAMGGVSSFRGWKSMWSLCPLSLNLLYLLYPI